MSLTVKTGPTTTIEPVPSDLHPAVCYGVIDIGTQSYTYQGQTKSNKQVVLLWEIPGVRVKGGEYDGQPRVLSKIYTQSLYEKSNLYKDLVSWRGKKFTSEELLGFDLENILGKPCLLNVVHTERNGNTYANIETVLRAKGTTSLTAENPLISYDIEKDNQIPDGVPEWVKQKITESPEYRGETHASEVNESNAPVETIPDDDIPF